MAKKQQQQQPVTLEVAGEVLDLKEAAEFLKVSKPTFYRWLAQGKLKGMKAGQQWRFQRADLEAFLQTDPNAPPTEVEGFRAAVDADRATRDLGPFPWGEGESDISRFVFALMEEAIRVKASDIHIEPDRHAARVRYRVDGVLQEALSFPREAAKAVVGRWKLLGDMDLNERRIPQDGRVHVTIEERNYDFRITTVPSMFGEALVARILDQSSVLIGMEKLGMTGPLRAAFEERLHVNQGLLVVTGPVGSGRTTTLYSALSQLNNSRIKIVTIEDPVEYALRGLIQVHVNRKMGLTFPTALRAFARCDPDVIMVGELRDMDTIGVALTAAMTGHLVLTVMHSADAVAAVARLLDVGVEPFLVASGLSTVVAQRLVRRVCESCKEPYQPSPEALKRLQEETGLSFKGATFARGRGCEQCHQYGYKGRIAMFEMLVPDERFREAVIAKAGLEELRRAAREAGIVTLAQDGLARAAAGITTVEEVMRVLALAR